LFALCLVLPGASGRVIRVETLSRQDVLGAAAFGDAGPYERIVGRVHFAVSISNPHNQRIVDLDKAGNLTDGEVEFSADFIAVRPKDAHKGNGALLLEVNRRFGTPVPPETVEVEDLSPLITPVDAEFRVGTMGLGWDSEAQTVVVELLAVSETEFDASVVLDDTEEGPDAVRVFLTPESAREFATRSNRVISAGRPPCPLCDEPLDPEGHICARTNGYRRSALLGPDDDAED